MKLFSIMLLFLYVNGILANAWFQWGKMFSLIC